MQPSDVQTFASREHLEDWLRVHHATRQELWIRLYKKRSGTPSVDWNDLVLAGLAWGWIDGIRKALDDVSFVQRMTPRRPQSTWSKKNREHAERLIAEGRMQPSGLAHVEAARRDGRWERAYAGAVEMVVPEDLLAAVAKNPAAAAFYATLDRSNLFAIYHRLQTGAPESRAKRIATIVAALARKQALR